jgi:predicted SprT family Zn-dependent metalloprotease
VSINWPARNKNASRMIPREVAHVLADLVTRAIAGTSAQRDKSHNYLCDACGRQGTVCTLFITNKEKERLKRYLCSRCTQAYRTILKNNATSKGHYRRLNAKDARFTITDVQGNTSEVKSITWTEDKS